MPPRPSLAALASALLLAILVTAMATGAGATTGSVTVLPFADGQDTAWQLYGGSGQAWQRLGEGACSTSDTSYAATSSQNSRRSVQLGLAAVPTEAMIVQVEVHVCYSDGNGTDTDERIRPYIRVNGVLTDGTEFAFGGSTTPALASPQQFTVNVVNGPTTVIEAGAQSTGTAAVRVYAVWAVITYSATPTPTATPTATT